MLIKIIVIFSILALGIFLITETNGMYSSSDVIDSVKEHVNTLEAKTSDSVDMGVGFMNTVDEVGDKIIIHINNAEKATKEIFEISEFDPLNKDTAFENIPIE